MGANRSREIFIWTKLDVSDYLSLREKLFTAPFMPGLRTMAHYDSGAGVVMIGLHFAANVQAFVDTVSWALSAGLGVIDPQAWSPGRRQQFTLDTLRFRCREDGDPAHRPLLELVHKFEERIGLGATRRRFPRASPPPDVPEPIHHDPTLHVSLESYLTRGRVERAPAIHAAIDAHFDLSDA